MGLTTFPNPFEDEPDQGYLPTLLSKVKAFTAPEPVVVQAEPPRKAIKPAPQAYAPTNLLRSSAAAPVVSVTPVVSVSDREEKRARRPSVSTIPDSPSFTNLAGNGEQNFTTIPGFPMADDARSVTGSLRRNGSVSKIIRRLRGEGLSKHYWMADENCKECYDCKSVFTTWRRKHHCRICGQVFCGRCAANIIKGYRFGHEGMVRVCNLCLQIMDEYDDDDRSVASESLPIIESSPEYSHSPFAASQLFTRQYDSLNSISETHWDDSRPVTPEYRAMPFRRAVIDEDVQELVLPDEPPEEEPEEVEEPQPQLARTRLSSRPSQNGLTALLDEPSKGDGLWRRRADSTIKRPDVIAGNSLAYFHRMLRQAIDRAELASPAEWERVLGSLLLKVSTHLQPNVRSGDSIDVRTYVKIKRIPGGKISDSEYVDGIVITKNVAHKQMARHLVNPRIMVLTFPLDYHRVENQFMSLEPLVTQEKDYLRLLTKRVIDVRPHIVLVERSASRLALDFLLDANIAVARSVKPSAIHQVARCTQADVIASMDRLALEPRLGRCSDFRIQTFEHDLIPGRRKTFMRFEGCQREYGCTLLLRGGDMETLRKVKAIADFMSLVVYNLKLEVCLFNDEHNMLPPRPPHVEQLGLTPEIQASLTPYLDTALSASAAVSFPPPEPLAKMAELDRALAEARVHAEARILPEARDRILRLPEEIAPAAALARTEHLHTEQLKLWSWYTKRHKTALRPEDYQGIVFLYSLVCEGTDKPCLGPTLQSHNYYQADDCTLGQFLETLAADAVKPCPSSKCDRLRLYHFRLLVHGRTRLQIAMDQFACPSPGHEDKIITWSYCRICSAPSPTAILRDETWKLSWGAYLEHCFYPPIAKAGFSCPHDAYRDQIRYFAHRNLAIRIHNEEIDLYETIGPAIALQLRPAQKVALKNQEYEAVLAKNTAYFESVLFRMKVFDYEVVQPEKVNQLKALLEELQFRAAADRDELVNLLNKTYEMSPMTDTLALNTVLRSMQDKVVQWDNDFTEIEKTYLPNEKDIRKMTATHLKRLFAQEVLIDKPAPEAEEKKEEPIELPKLDVDLQIEDTTPTVEVARSPLSRRHTGGYESDSTIRMDVPSSGIDSDVFVSRLPKRSKPAPTIADLVKRFQEQADDHISEASESEQEFRPRLRRGRTDSLRRQTSDGDGSYAKNASRLNSPVLHRQSSQKVSIISLDGDDNDAGGEAGHMATRPSLTRAQSNPNKLGKGNAPARSLALRGRRQATLQGNRVSSIARHFDRLSREAERDRQKRLSLARGKRARPVGVTKAKVQVFNNVRDAFKDEFDTDSSDADNEDDDEVESDDSEHKIREATPEREISLSERLHIELPPFDTSVPLTTNPTPQLSDAEPVPMSESEMSSGPERSSILKTLSGLWAFRTGEYAPLEYPLTAAEHVFADSRIIMREDEPTSIIAFTLSSRTHREKLRNVRTEETSERSWDVVSLDEAVEADVSNEGTHLKYGYADGSSKLTPDFESGSSTIFCRVFFAEQFAALRQACGCEESFTESLARCVKWDSSGGKSGSAFLKTKDDRFIAKELSRLEMDALTKFAPSYFEYMRKAVSGNRPTVLAKVYGFFKIGYRNATTGRAMRMNVLIMENLFYERRFAKIYDLKGSTRNRLVQATGKVNEVLLDENLLEIAHRHPLYMRDHSKRILRTALYNDTLFLSNLNVMDYSLVVGVDVDRHELVIGIVDYIRTFTWDKKLESWVKDTPFLGGTGKGEPTIVTPKQYKARFRAAMEKNYFQSVPDRWTKTELEDD